VNIISATARGKLKVDVAASSQHEDRDLRKKSARSRLGFTKSTITTGRQKPRQAHGGGKKRRPKLLSPARNVTAATSAPSSLRNVASDNGGVKDGVTAGTIDHYFRFLDGAPAQNIAGATFADHDPWAITT